MISRTESKHKEKHNDMPGINLAKSTYQKAEAEKKKRSGSGLSFIIAILVLVIAGWGGLVFYDQRLSKELDALSSEIAQRRTELSGIESGESVVEKIADFQHRVEIVGDNLSSGKEAGELLRVIESSMVPGVTLTKYVLDTKKGMIVLEGESDALDLIAQELVLLKRSPSVAEVSVENIERDKDGKMVFSVGVALAGFGK